MTNIFKRLLGGGRLSPEERLRRLWTVTEQSDIAAIELLPEDSIPQPPQIQKRIDVVIPVYNGVDHLRRLLPLLFKHTSQPHRFIFVDDCSPAPETKEYLLETINGRSDCLLLENDENLGFPRTVNRAVTHVASPYFVILNTDVLVPDGWLERMIAPFLVDKKIATVTPFTNSGSFYSFPQMGQDNQMEHIEDFEEWDRVFRRLPIKDRAALEFINGTGFCMAIRTECWNNLGGFDVEAFGRGYGEETDLSLRFLDKGLKNVLVPNLFVYHQHGGSFPSEEKQTLMQAHHRIIEQRWQRYLNLIPLFIDSDPWRVYRQAVLSAQEHEHME